MKMDITLPPKYYLEHFMDLVREVKKYHAAFLDEKHHSFLDTFHHLNENAQLIFVRMMNRKGPLFDKNEFSYAEIEEIHKGWQELQEKNFIRSISESDLDIYLARLTKSEISNFLQGMGISFKRSEGRNDLLVILQKQKYLLEGFSKKETNLILMNYHEELKYILFLYFGNIQKKLLLPTLRDLGIKKSNKKAQIGAKFKNKNEALSHFFFSSLKEDQTKSFKSFGLKEVQEWPGPILLETKLIREELLLNLARDEIPENGLEFLRLCEFYPASEKRARLLHQLGHLKECQKELERMMDAPWNDEELLFAEDFLQRKYHKKKLSLLTETLRNAEKVFIDESFFRHPEFGVLDFYKNQGHAGYFSENYLFITLFWNIFSEELEGSAHSEFDHAPPELKEKTFHTLHQDLIEAKLSALSLESLLILADEDEILSSFIRATHVDGLRSMLRYMSQDYYARSSGFPDLFVIKHGKVVFYEIKAEGDSLKANQLIQMRQLEKAGYEVKVLQVFYQYNENQTYVVVDLETTGMVSNYNRITEIGAVKIQGGKIVDTFQTLINPQRSIPSMIQDLTGITNEMVRNSPLFEEVAEKFLEFMKDSIFVAHNVNFDYSFLQNEYLRLEKTFVKPFICTKASMKKHYPELGSYGLKNLCAHFNISLVGHHRALNDAMAATELLKIINQKRSDASHL
jgi:DNA polymerase-3 subunit epsilon